MKFCNTQKINDTFSFEFEKNAESDMVALPTTNFCVRKPTAVFAKGRHWIYADIVPYDSPYWPLTYNTSIHAWSSIDCRSWTHHGEVLSRGVKGQWDFGNVFTPGAIALDGKIYLFYTGMASEDGYKCKMRHIGLAVADDPAGPFVKYPEAIQISKCDVDDSCPIVSADGTIFHYFREALHHKPEPNYKIKLSKSTDFGKTWSEPIDILRADEKVRAYEAMEVKLLGNLVLLCCFEHYPVGSNDDYKSGLWISEDGENFTECSEKYLDDHLLDGWESCLCGFQWCLIPDTDDMYRYIGVARPVDIRGNYNTYIFPIKPLPVNKP